MDSETITVINTESEQAYVGNVTGREIIFHRSRDEVQAGLDHDDPSLKHSRTFK